MCMLLHMQYELLNQLALITLLLSYSLGENSDNHLTAAIKHRSKIPKKQNPLQIKNLTESHLSGSKQKALSRLHRLAKRSRMINQTPSCSL